MNNFLRSGLFGDLFQDEPVATLFSGDRFVSQMLRFETAWTAALHAVGAVTPENAEAARGVIARFSPDWDALREASNRDGLPVPGLIRQLRGALPTEVAQAIHSGATSQDVIDTAMVLTLLDSLDLLGARLEALMPRLDTLRAAAQSREMMGRTRMQVALPIPVDARLAAWQGPLHARLQELPALRAQIGVVQCGGPVGLRDVPDGQGEAAARRMAEHLGLVLTPVWHSDRSGMVAVGHWLTLVGGALGKMGQDIALMAQQGVDEIALKGVGGSSAMPHKRNPILAETLVTLARYTAAQQGGLAQCLVHEQERSGAAWALEWMILPAMTEATGAALRHAGSLLDQIERIGPER